MKTYKPTVADIYQNASKSKGQHVRYEPQSLLREVTQNSNFFFCLCINHTVGWYFENVAEQFVLLKTSFTAQLCCNTCPAVGKADPTWFQSQSYIRERTTKTTCRSKKC